MRCRLGRTFVVSLDPPGSFSHLAILASGTKGCVTGKQSFGELPLGGQLFNAVKGQVPKTIMRPQQLILRVQRLWFLVLRDDMSDWANVNNGGLWRGDHRVIVGFEYFVGAGFCWLWWFHRILRLKGFVVFVVWMMCVVNMFVCLVSGLSMVAQKARKERAPEAVVVRPTLVVGSNGTVSVNCHWDQKTIICLLVINAPVPSALG